MAERYPLEELLRVRLFREDNAANTLTQCRSVVEAAKLLIEERKQELKDYIEWRIKQEAQLYEDIFDKQVKLKSLDDLKQDIQLLREKQVLYVEKIRDAEQQLKVAEDALKQAHEVYLNCVKERQKIDEHKEIWSKEAAKIAESDAEKELEDFRVRMQDDEYST